VFVCVCLCVCVCVCVLRACSSSFCVCMYHAAWLYHPHCNALQRIVMCNTSLRRVIMQIAKCCSVLLCATMCSIYICIYYYTYICIYIYIHICAHAYVYISLDEGVEVNCFFTKTTKKFHIKAQPILPKRFALVQPTPRAEFDVIFVVLNRQSNLSCVAIS